MGKLPTPGLLALLAALFALGLLGRVPATAWPQIGLLGTGLGSLLAIGGGISAMPSVHNGLAILFALAAYFIKKDEDLVKAADRLR